MSKPKLSYFYFCNQAPITDGFIPFAHCEALIQSIEKTSCVFQSANNRAMTNSWTTGQVVRDRDASRHFWLQPANQFIDAPFCALEENTATTAVSRQSAPRELEDDPIEEDEPPIHWIGLFM